MIIIFTKELMISYVLSSLGAGLLGLFSGRLTYPIMFWDHFLVDYTIISISGFVLLGLGLISFYKTWKKILS